MDLSTRKRGGYALRLLAPLGLGCILWFIGWGTLNWLANAEEPFDCVSQPVFSKRDGPSYLISPSQPLVYTLTNQAGCTDTYIIEAATVSNRLFVDYWEPTTLELESNQNSAITVHMPILADAGTITDTIVITVSSQLTDSVEVVLEDTVIMPGSVFPPPNSIYIPLVIK